jgi:8-oxo-dGTP pyrophosphatase MutT (NUDIX family)
MAEQLFQIGVKGLIRNGKGEILMVHIPAWGKVPPHWDLPGGRMDPGESLLETTLKRELQEELGITYAGKPRQLSAFVTNITIPVGDVRYPLLFVVYETELPDGAVIRLDPTSAEDDYRWFSPAEAAEEMAMKFTEDFRDLVRNLS